MSIFVKPATIYSLNKRRRMNDESKGDVKEKSYEEIMRQ